MEHKIRKIIIGFFLVMVALTFVSRAAASVMVAKVSTAKADKGSLTYSIEGTGVVNENAKKYVELQNGYKIGKVSVRLGQQVEQGDALFAYDVNQLMDKKAELKKELQKLQLTYEKAKLNEEDSIESKEAVQTKENANEDLEEAKNKLEEKKETIKVKKKEEYEEAKSILEDTNNSWDDAMETAERAVEDADTELQELLKPQQTAEAVIKDYKSALVSANSALISKARTSIFDFYYNGTYAEHQNSVNEAQDKLKRAQEDLIDLQNKWNSQINFWDQYSPDLSVRKAYQVQLESRDSEIKNANRTISDLQKSLQDIIEKDIKLDKAINNYRNYVMQGTPTDAFDSLYKILYDNLKVNETQINKAQKKLDRAKEDAEQTQKEWDKKLGEAEAKVKNLKDELLRIKDQSYDYSEDLNEYETALNHAMRGVKSADLILDKARNNLKAGRMDLLSIKLDIEGKKDEISQVQQMIDSNGVIPSPVSGVVLTLDLEDGITLSGQEKLIIGTGGYELSMKASKDDMKNFTEGDEVRINIGDGKDPIISSIEKIELPDQESNVVFTAILPEGDYRSGAVLEYELKKNSEDFSCCVPIQALREDSKSTFLLLARESDSVLGKTENAFRLDVQVISQDSKYAAVKASLTEDDLIITGSNKNIAEGDRVHVANTQ